MKKRQERGLVGSLWAVGVAVVLLLSPIPGAGTAHAQDPIGRKPSIIHRTVLTCDGELVKKEHKVSLAKGYRNYKCENRFAEHCVEDGTWDQFYMEWCEYESPKCIATTLHRTGYTCDGEVLKEDEVIDLAESGYSNYKCRNRFQEQCIDDGSFDAYYDEWCEYSCDPGAVPLK